MKKCVCIFTFISFLITLGCFSNQETKWPIYQHNENSKPVYFAPGLEPTGFNGIKWETTVSSIEGMQHHRTDLSYGGVEFYLRKGDTFKLENGRTLPIQYGFWKGKFYIGIVYIKGKRDWNALKETVFRKFGEGSKAWSNKEEYLWLGENSLMALGYNEDNKTGTYYIKSESMLKQMEAHGSD